jgi:carboxymethylenebutenolidase
MERSGDGVVLTAIPKGTPRGAIVVLHDIFGLSDYIEDVAEDLVGRGWLVVAPALFLRDGIERVDYDRVDVGSAAAARLTADHVLADIDTGLGLARDRVPAGSTTAAVGFCLGGSLASYAATERPLDACVSFYGGVLQGEADGVPSLLDSIERIRAPWLGVYGEEDPFIPLADVERLQEQAGRFRVPAEVATYPGGHAFHRHTTPDYYSPESAPLAWDRAMGWLDRFPGSGA